MHNRFRSLNSCFRDELRWDLVLDHFSGKRGMSRITPEATVHWRRTANLDAANTRYGHTMWLLPTYTSDSSECKGDCVGSTFHLIVSTSRNPFINVLCELRYGIRARSPCMSNNSLLRLKQGQSTRRTQARIIARNMQATAPHFITLPGNTSCI